MAKQARKRFKPSMRERKRYIVAVLDKKHNWDFLRQIVRNKCNVDVRIIGFNEKGSKVMFCILRKHAEKIRKALKDEGFNCIGVSGTIKRARQKWG